MTKMRFPLQKTMTRNAHWKAVIPMKKCSLESCDSHENLILSLEGNAL
jgi:hypothetical protein